MGRGTRAEAQAGSDSEVCMVHVRASHDKTQVTAGNSSWSCRDSLGQLSPADLLAQQST